MPMPNTQNPEQMQDQAKTRAGANQQQLLQAAIDLDLLRVLDGTTPLTPRAAWEQARGALSSRVPPAELPALAEHNLAPVLGDLDRMLEEQRKPEGRPGPLVLLFDNCCAANKETRVVETYTCKGGDSYSYGVVQVGSSGLGLLGAPPCPPLVTLLLLLLLSLAPGACAWQPALLRI